MNQLFKHLLCLCGLSLCFFSCAKDDEKISPDTPSEPIIEEPTAPAAQLQTLPSGKIVVTHQGKLAELFTQAGVDLTQEIDSLAFVDFTLTQSHIQYLNQALRHVRVLDLSRATLAVAYEEYGFKDNKNVDTLILPDNLRSIGFGQLGYTHLRHIVWGKSIKTLGEGALSFSNQLEQLNLPESIDVLDARALSFMRSIRQLDIPKSINILPEGCCQMDAALQTVHIHGELKRIADRAFSGCKSLEKIVFTQRTPPAIRLTEWPFPEPQYMHDAEGHARFHFVVPQGTADDYRAAFGMTRETDKTYFVEYTSVP